MRDTRTLLPAAPTPPAPSALLPRPQEGAGSVRGDTWWEAVSGSSPGSPHAVDRGDIATGGGADGEGELVPPPLSLMLQIPYFSGNPHPTRACGAPPPPPLGAGQCPGVYQESSRIRGGAGGQPYLILLPSIPVHRIVVDIGIGGGGRETGPHPRGARAVCLPDACGLKPAL